MELDFNKYKHYINENNKIIDEKINNIKVNLMNENSIIIDFPMAVNLIVSDNIFVYDKYKFITATQYNLIDGSNILINGNTHTYILNDVERTKIIKFIYEYFNLDSKEIKFKLDNKNFNRNNYL